VASARHGQRHGRKVRGRLGGKEVRVNAVSRVGGPLAMLSRLPLIGMLVEVAVRRDAQVDLLQPPYLVLQFVHLYRQQRYFVTMCLPSALCGQSQFFELGFVSRAEVLL
jgi:hypothetical protein